MKTCLVLVTCKNISEARKIARGLLINRLVVCVNILPGVESHYRWQGKIQKSSEVLLMVKTKSSLARKVSASIVKLHRYECPMIEVLSADLHSEMAKKWLEKELDS